MIKRSTDFGVVHTESASAFGNFSITYVMPSMFIFPDARVVTIVDGVAFMNLNEKKKRGGGTKVVLKTGVDFKTC